MTAIRLADTIRMVIDSLMRTPYVRSLELQQEQLRADMQLRLREKDAVIHDLKVRLAIAETDAMREKQTRAVAAPARPVPDFGGPIPYQDELANMSRQPADPGEKADGA